MPRTRQVALGAAFNWLAFAATLAVAFFLTPFLLHRLGPSRYDIWCIVEAILAYFTILDLGIAACLSRAVAGAKASDDGDRLNRMASSCVVLYSIAGLVAIAVGSPILFAISGSLEAREPGDGGILPFMLLMLANLALTLPLSAFPAMLEGLQAFTTKSLIRIAMLAVRTVALVVAVSTWQSLFPLAVIYTATNLIEHSLMAWMVRGRLRELKLKMAYVDRATLKAVRGYSVDAFLAMVAGRITVQSAAIAIGMVLAPGQVTLFATASRLIEYSKGMLRTMTATLSPNVAAMQARGDSRGIAAGFLAGAKWMVAIALPIQIGLVLFGWPFLARWIGSDYAEGTFPALIVLSIPLALSIVQSVASRVLYGLGELKWFARAGLVEAALHVVLLAVLIRPFGIVGVAYSCTIPSILSCLFTIEFTRRLLKVAPLELIAATCRPVAACGVPLSIWWMLGTPDADYGRIAVHVALGLIPYGAIVLCWEGLAWKVVGRVGKWRATRTVDHRLTM